MVKIIGLFLLSLAGTGQVSTKSNIPDKLDQHMQHYVEQEQFQGVILAAQNGRVLFRKAYGYADIEAKIPNTIDKKFLIGSMTKSFTAVAILRLVDQGKLDLHEPISTYIPELTPELSQELNLHLLLKHQSGLSGHLEHLTNFENKDVSPDAVLAIINSSERSFKPGSAYQYSNLNYHLAAIAIERVTGKSYSEAMQDFIFEPLSMKDSGVERLSHTPQNRAKGYRKGGVGINHDENIVSYALGSGDIYSTVDDLFKWEQSLYGDKLLSQESIQMALAGETEALGYYGYGFRIREYQRRAHTRIKGKLARHGGSMDGFYSNLHRYIDDRLTIIVLANIRAFPIRNLTFELKEIILRMDGLNRNRGRFE